MLQKYEHVTEINTGYRIINRLQKYKQVTEINISYINSYIYYRNIFLGCWINKKKCYYCSLNNG